MQGIFEIVRRVFGGSRSKRQCRIILTTNPEGPLHLQLWTLVATLPLSRKKWKAAAQKFIILGVPMTGYGREFAETIVRCVDAEFPRRLSGGELVQINECSVPYAVIRLPLGNSFLIANC